ncbi:hypothetical protein CEXT_391591 [Caerostris extrusa]|uniref:Uncharacterized protein n=1 Tax=Caerostris extrusa TaxID=172846 RepID=A0AAV4XEP9_CAEEX|nr:hypothetical protein CEXT_391591 [Caerostris extrusa]
MPPPPQAKKTDRGCEKISKKRNPNESCHRLKVPFFSVSACLVFILRSIREQSLPGAVSSAVFRFYRFLSIPVGREMCRE